jgi:hypothetical protein
MTDPVYCIMPILAHPEYTRAAIADCLSQSVPTRLLLINQGVDDAFREELERIAEEHDDRVLLWSHQPPLPSLAATWNRALEFAWACGGTEALVVNNDARLRADTVELLARVLDPPRQLFVSAVGVMPDQFTPVEPLILSIEPECTELSKGGPDFSCFLISRECHEQFRFDEHFTPAFCEDLDYHRRLMLAGEGARIFSVNLPYLHYGSMTLKTVKDRGVIDRAIVAGSRAYYRKKWGGDCNQETFLRPFGGGWSELAKVTDGTATTPYLQALAANPSIVDLTRKMLGLEARVQRGELLSDRENDELLEGRRG